MIYIHGKLLEKTERPPSPGWDRPLRLTKLLAGDDVLTIVTDEEAFEQLEGLERLDDVVLRVSLRRVDLAAMGGKGAAYRLRAIGVGGST